MSPGDVVRTPWRQRLADLGRGSLALGVWLVMAGVSGWLLLRRASQVEIVGLARATEHEVSSPLALTLRVVSVELFEAVEPGQRLAVLDAADLDARLETSRAVVAQLRAELEGAREALGVERHAREEERLAELRRFERDEQELELRRLELEVDLAAERVDEQRLGLDLARVRPLEAGGIATAGELDTARLAHAALVERIRRTEQLLDGVAASIADARHRRAEFLAFAPVPPSPAAEQAFLERIRVEELRLHEIEIERRTRVLRAPVRGIVQRLCAAPGQALAPGEPVAVVVSSLSDEIVAYLPEDGELDVRAGERALVTLARPPWTAAEALVVRVGPAVELLPERLWRDPALPEYGLPVVARGGPAPLLHPGERVRLRLVR